MYTCIYEYCIYDIYEYVYKTPNRGQGEGEDAWGWMGARRLTGSSL